MSMPFYENEHKYDFEDKEDDCEYVRKVKKLIRESQESFIKEAKDLFAKPREYDTGNSDWTPGDWMSSLTELKEAIKSLSYLINSNTKNN